MNSPAADRLLSEFPPGSAEAWRKLVQTELKDVPFEKKVVTSTYDDANRLLGVIDWEGQTVMQGLHGISWRQWITSRLPRSANWSEGSPPWQPSTKP